MKINNTVLLQKNPVDLHINPKCIINACIAFGRFVNDDGYVFDYKGH